MDGFAFTGPDASYIGPRYAQNVNPGFLVPNINGIPEHGEMRGPPADSLDTQVVGSWYKANDKDFTITEPDQVGNDVLWNVVGSVKGGDLVAPGRRTLPLRIGFDVRGDPGWLSGVTGSRSLNNVAVMLTHRTASSLHLAGLINIETAAKARTEPEPLPPPITDKKKPKTIGDRFDDLLGTWRTVAIAGAVIVGIGGIAYILGKGKGVSTS